MLTTDVDATIAKLRAGDEPFVVATVVRALASTAARAGAKAVLDGQGRIVAGFLGGGCVRSAVAGAARDALAQRQPQLLSLKPEELLEADGVTAGEARDGVRYARNGCPSKGSMDVFVEPILPRPLLLVAGSGPVALALIDLASRFDLALALVADDAERIAGSQSTRTASPAESDTVWSDSQFTVVATQGQGDRDALMHALNADTPFVAFVGSRRKFAAVSERLIAEGADPGRLAQVRAPAGIHIHAITPEEIALSILCEIVAYRRSSDRPALPGSSGEETADEAPA